MTDLLRTEAAKLGITLADKMFEEFLLYTDVLLEWNGKMNLTAIVQPEEIAVKHYIDSLLLIAAHDIPHGAAVIDIGSGAGFPGIPLKIARPDINLSLLDSQNKRLRFLETLSENLGQDNRLIHGRAEELAHDMLLRERFDVATARAVAPLALLCELCLAYVKKDGVFLAMKGAQARRELEDAATAIERMGARMEDIRDYSLNETEARSIIIIRKISQTSTGLPRTHKKMTKAPL